MSRAATAFRSSISIRSQLTPNPPQPNSHFSPKPNPNTNNLLLSTQKKLSAEFKEKIICLEVMGVDSGKALSINPSLLTASLSSIHQIITFLQSKGIQQKNFPKIFGLCPKILTSDIKSDLIPVFNFLTSHLNVPEQDFGRIITKCPRLLTCSVENQLQPTLFYLQRLGFEDLEALIYRDTTLLVLSVENTLIPKLKFFENVGFSASETKEMVLRCPGLLTYSVENNFKPKLEYFLEEMEGKLENLKEFPHFFAFSLEKRIKPRHIEAMNLGIRLPLGKMLKSTDEEFMQLLSQRSAR